MKKVHSPQELSVIPVTLNLKAHIVKDLKKMESFTKKSMDDLVSTALLMFIATHNDFLGKNRT